MERIQLFSTRLLAANPIVPGGGPGQSSGAGSPFNDFTAGAVIYVLLTLALVLILLMAAFVAVNLAMMSKRPEDQALPRHREPSDPGFLKSQVWPQAPFQEKKLPAEEAEDDTDVGAA